MELSRDQVPADLMEFFEPIEPCGKCYVCQLVAVFREVRRVLRKDGTVWLNLGDSYAQGGSGGYGPASTLSGYTSENTKHRVAYDTAFTRKAPPGLKPKDLVGIPWRVAFALQADGWYLRSDIIWSKPNPMPESVTDRPTKSHEYLFLLAKSARYYFDADAVREPYSPATESFNAMKAGYDPDRTAAVVVARSQQDPTNPEGGTVQRGNGGLYLNGGAQMNPAGRNIRSVWTVATAPYPGAHFATFPPKLIEPCIKAGTSERGVCPECGAPFERVVERKDHGLSLSAAAPVPRNTPTGGIQSRRVNNSAEFGKPGSADLPPRLVQTTGWRPSCAHTADPVPATVLDPIRGQRDNRHGGPNPCPAAPS